MDVRQAVAEDIAEPDEDRQVDAAQLQVIDELLEIDCLLGILRRVDEHVAGLADGEVALAPAVDLESSFASATVQGSPMRHGLGRRVVCVLTRT